MTGKVTTTLKVLTQMRDEQRSLRDEMQQTRTEVAELAQVVTTELRAVASVIVDLKTVLTERLELRDTVRDHEKRLRALERRRAS